MDHKYIRVLVLECFPCQRRAVVMHFIMTTTKEWNYLRPQLCYRLLLQADVPIYGISACQIGFFIIPGHGLVCFTLDVGLTSGTKLMVQINESLFQILLWPEYFNCLVAFYNVSNWEAISGYKCMYFCWISMETTFFVCSVAYRAVIHVLVKEYILGNVLALCFLSDD